MPCRIGMATSIAARKSQLEREGLVPPNAEWEMLEEGLTYVEATLAENKQLKKCGPHCEGAPGEGYVRGRVWKIYLAPLVGNQVAICRILFQHLDQDTLRRFERGTDKRPMHFRLNTVWCC